MKPHFHALRYSGLLVGLAIGLAASGARAHAGDESDDEIGSLGIGNFSEVSPGIFRGARPPLPAIANLKRVRVHTVIDLQGGDGDLPYGAGRLMTWFEPGEHDAAIAADGAEAQAQGMRFFNFPLPSVKIMDASEDRAVDQALQVIHASSASGVIVHCEHGNDRTGMVIALYRVCYEGVVPAVAHQEMVRMGHTLFNRVMTWPMDKYFWKKTRAACGPVSGQLD